MVSFTIPGDPQALKRHRSARRGERIVQYDPAENKTAKARVQRAWQAAGHQALPKGQPLSVTLACFFPRPKSHYGTGKNKTTLKATAARWHVARPDGDNIIKLIGDALNGHAWHDDSQVALWQLVKMYDDIPQTKVTITPLEPWIERWFDAGQTCEDDCEFCGPQEPPCSCGLWICPECRPERHAKCCGQGCSRCKRKAA